jgi:hypothetical protein
LAHGATFEDAARVESAALLEGSGQVHRYVTFEDAADVARPGVKKLLASGIAEWKKQSRS